MNLFNEYNTEGYTKEELDMLNAEWNAIVEGAELEEGSDSYNRAAKEFCDSVANR